MKLVCTVTDVAAVVHAGGSPETKSAIIEISDDRLPTIVHKYFECVEWAKNNPSNGACYSQLTFSVLQE